MRRHGGSYVAAAPSMLRLAPLGALAARAGGVSAAVGAGRVVFRGAVAMAATAGIGKLGTTIG